MKTIHYIALASIVSTLGIAACRLGGDGMSMPPPGSAPTQSNSAAPSEVDPNLHVTLPPNDAGANAQPMPQPRSTAGSHAGMPGMDAGGMGAGQPMSNMGNKGGMGPMDAGAPMGAMEDGGMKPGCCGKPMPMPPSKPPMQPMPMPMKPEHGGGHM